MLDARMRPLRIESFNGSHAVTTVEELNAVARARTPEDEARLYVTPPEESRPLLVIEIAGQHAYLHFLCRHRRWPRRAKHRQPGGKSGSFPAFRDCRARVLHRHAARSIEGARTRRIRVRQADQHRVVRSIAKFWQRRLTIAQNNMHTWLIQRGPLTSINPYPARRAVETRSDVVCGVRHCRPLRVPPRTAF